MAMQNQTSLGREIQILCNRLGFSVRGIAKHIGANVGVVHRALEKPDGYPARHVMRRVLLTLFEYGATPSEQVLLLSLYLSFRRAVLNDATVLCGLLIKEMEKK